MRKSIGYVGSFIRLIFIIPLIFIALSALIVVAVCIVLGDIINSITGCRGKTTKTMIEILETISDKLETIIAESDQK